MLQSVAKYSGYNIRFKLHVGMLVECFNHNGTTRFPSFWMMFISCKTNLSGKLFLILITKTFRRGYYNDKYIDL